MLTNRWYIFIYFLRHSENILGVITFPRTRIHILAGFVNLKTRDTHLLYYWSRGVPHGSKISPVNQPADRRRGRPLQTRVSHVLNQLIAPGEARSLSLSRSLLLASNESGKWNRGAGATSAGGLLLYLRPPAPVPGPTNPAGIDVWS